MSFAPLVRIDGSAQKKGHVPHLFALLIVTKFVGVLAYAGGLGAAFATSDAKTRARAVHSVASPALVVVWASGLGLATLLGIRYFELWILGGFAFSLASLLALIHASARGRTSRGAFLAVALPLVIVLVLMALRPAWPHGGS